MYEILNINPTDLIRYRLQASKLLNTSSLNTALKLLKLQLKIYSTTESLKHKSLLAKKLFSQ